MRYCWDMTKAKKLERQLEVVEMALDDLKEHQDLLPADELRMVEDDFEGERQRLLVELARLEAAA